MQELKMAPQQPCACMSGGKPQARQWSTGRMTLAGGALLLLWMAVYSQLRPFASWVTESLLGLDSASHMGAAVEFFVYDTPKVLLLLALIVFFIGVVRSWFTPEKTRAMLAGKREVVGNGMAACLGVLTPFCSCSAVPLFVGFVSAGIPLGVTFSFLIAAPMVNEVALVLLYGMFGWKVALLYLVTGLTIAMAAGWVIGRLHMEKHLQDWVRNQLSMGGAPAHGVLTLSDRARAGVEAVREIVGKVWVYVVLGIAVGAGIHGYVPQDFMASIMGREAWWSVPLAVVIGIPMYTNAAGVVPVIHALIGKGAALGSALAFMMSVIALSLPEMLILKKVLKVRLIVTFASVVGCGILIVGYLFNMIL
ncbi:permease [Salidesulfovibrio onnuriiensis]|uniref:permease n=1 Tax=Salidesulfovibrio onnuriiensis TaxID=2583823 RepID=UPI0011CAF30A|nr:permease [Salidesulfovibrio onnuriiensis]